MIFAATVEHAKEITGLLPANDAALITGDTAGPERDALIAAFKQQQFRFLVNVSVLTTGFDAPHVDLIAILRPAESVSLYQQIVGRGLRLAPENRLPDHGLRRQPARSLRAGNWVHPKAKATMFRYRCSAPVAVLPTHSGGKPLPMAR